MSQATNQNEVEMSQSNNITKTPTKSIKKNDSPLKERIMKIKKSDNFTIVSNDVINDYRMSWEARGLLIYLLSKPNDWEVRFEDLIANGPAGEFKITGIIKELEKFGYIERHRVRECGRYMTITFVYESPPPEVYHGGKAMPLISTEELSTEAREMN